MKNKSFVYTYLFTLIGGVLLIILHNRVQLFEAISIIIGICFLGIGVVSMLSSVFISDRARADGVRRSPAMIIVSAASLILGLLMVVAPSFFVRYIIYTFGVVLLLVGLIQLCNFMPKMGGIGFGWYFLIVPCLSILSGIIVFTVGADKIMNSIALLTGIILAVYSINGFIGYFKRRSLFKAYQDKRHPEDAIIDIK